MSEDDWQEVKYSLIDFCTILHLRHYEFRWVGERRTAGGRSLWPPHLINEGKGMEAVVVEVGAMAREWVIQELVAHFLEWTPDGVDNLHLREGEV